MASAPASIQFCFAESELPPLFPAPSSYIYSPAGTEKERFTLCLAVMADGSKVPLRIIFKGTPFIPLTTPGKGKRAQPRNNPIAAEVTPGNRTKFGHSARSMSLGVQ